MVQFRGRQAKHSAGPMKSADLSGQVSKINQQYQASAQVMQQQIQAFNAAQLDGMDNQATQIRANNQLALEQEARKAEWNNRILDNKQQQKLKNQQRMQEQRLQNAQADIQNQSDVFRLQQSMKQQDLAAVTDLGKQAIGLSKSLWKAEAERINEQNAEIQAQAAIYAQQNPEKFLALYQNLNKISEARLDGQTRNAAMADAMESAGLKNDASLIRNSNSHWLYGVQEGLAQHAAGQYGSFINEFVTRKIYENPGKDSALVEAEALAEGRREFYKKHGLAAINPAIVRKFFHRAANAEDTALRARSTQVRAANIKKQYQETADSQALTSMGNIALGGMENTEALSQMAMDLQQMTVSRQGDAAGAIKDYAVMAANKILSTDYKNLDQATRLKDLAYRLFSTHPQGQEAIQLFDSKLKNLEVTLARQAHEMRDFRITEHVDKVIAEVTDETVSYQEAQELLQDARDEVQALYPGPQNAVLRSKLLARLHSPTITKPKAQEMLAELQSLNPLERAQEAKEILADANITDETIRNKLERMADLGKAVEEIHGLSFVGVKNRIAAKVQAAINVSDISGLSKPDSNRLKRLEDLYFNKFISDMVQNPAVDLTQDQVDVPDLFNAWMTKNMTNEEISAEYKGEALAGVSDNSNYSQILRKSKTQNINGKPTAYVGHMSAKQMKDLGIKPGMIDDVSFFKSRDEMVAEVTRMEQEAGYVPPQILAAVEATGRSAGSIIRGQMRLMGDTGTFEINLAGSDQTRVQEASAIRYARQSGMTAESAKLFSGLTNRLGDQIPGATAAEKYGYAMRQIKAQSPTAWATLKARNATAAQKAAAQRDLLRIQIGYEDRATGAATDATNPAHVIQQMKAAGVPDDKLVVMLAIAMGEGMGSARARNNNPATGDDSYGAFQINMIGDMGPARRQQYGLKSNEDLYDLGTNVRVAKGILDSQGLGAWGAYNNGSYKRHMAKARRAVNAYLQSTGQTKRDGSNAITTGSRPNLQVIEYLTGDRSHGAYKADHGGSNYHEHIAFKTTAQRDLAIEMLEAAGIQVGAVEDGKHSPNSYHYANASPHGGLAIDVPMPHDLPWTAQAERKWSQKIRTILGIR